VRGNPLGRENLLRILPPESVAARGRPPRPSEEICPGAVGAFTPAVSRIRPWFPPFYSLMRNRGTVPILFPISGPILLADKGLVKPWARRCVRRRP